MNDLHQSITNYVRECASLDLVTGHDLRAIEREVAATFVADPNRIWWWEALRTPARSVAYDDDGLDLVEAALRELPGPLQLVVTDDDPPPWIGIRGSLLALLDLLREHRHFEYFVVDDTLAWILFDTHHNSIVTSGIDCPSDP